MSRSWRAGGRRSTPRCKQISAQREGPRGRRAGDVGTAAGVQRAYDEAMAAFGKVDIVVNNAGTSRNGPFEKLTDEILQDDLELKLFAAVRLAAWSGRR